MTIHEKRIYWIVVYTSGAVPQFLAANGFRSDDVGEAVRFRTEEDARQMAPWAGPKRPPTIACVHSDCTYTVTMPEGA
jgi:hypothetical protein